MFFYKYILLFILFVTSSCSDLVPLYVQDDEAQEKILNMKILPIEGRYGVFLKNELEETFGVKDYNSTKEYLILDTKIEIGTYSVESFNPDGTGSRFKAGVNINYQLYDFDGCLIFSDTISTNASYNSKSGGYDFGNKASERAAIKRNIEYNIKNVYPRIYYEIKNVKEPLPSFAPFIAIENQRWC